MAIVYPDTQRRAEQGRNRHRPADKPHHAQAKPDGPSDFALRLEFARRLGADLPAERRPGSYSWTLMLLVIGLCLGCLNAWHWVSKEDKEMREEQENNDE